LELGLLCSSPWTPLSSSHSSEGSSFISKATVGGQQAHHMSATSGTFDTQFTAENNTFWAKNE